MVIDKQDTPSIKGFTINVANGEVKGKEKDKIQKKLHQGVKNTHQKQQPEIIEEEKNKQNTKLLDLVLGTKGKHVKNESRVIEKVDSHSKCGTQKNDLAQDVEVSQKQVWPPQVSKKQTENT